MNRRVPASLICPDKIARSQETNPLITQDHLPLCGNDPLLEEHYAIQILFKG